MVVVVVVGGGKGPRVVDPRRGVGVGRAMWTDRATLTMTCLAAWSWMSAVWTRGESVSATNVCKVVVVVVE